jgi:hypothetical protein
MNLTQEELEEYIGQICTGKKIVDVDDKTILFRYPDLYIKLKAYRIYESEYNKSIEEGLLSNDDMRELIEGRELITEYDKSKLISLKSKLEAQKLLLSKTVKVEARQDRIKSIIDKMELEIREIEYKEHSKFAMTAETRAEESKVLYLCWVSCYDFFTDKLYWESQEDFSAESDYLLRQKIISEFILFYGGIPTSYIRLIARSNLWRIRYVTSLKTSEPLFGVSTAGYTNDMLNLAYWSHYYQNIYEMLPEDQPSEDIIEDDQALDAYLQSYYEERNRESKIRKDKRSRSGKLSAFDSEEVIVTRSNELYEDIDYDKPKEAQLIKDKTLISKHTRRG